MPTENRSSPPTAERPLLDRASQAVPVLASVGLVAACALAPWPARSAAAQLAHEELFWKGAYALLLLASLCVLWPAAFKRLARRVSDLVPERDVPPWWWFDAIACTYTFVPLMQLSIVSPRPEGSSLQHLNGFPSGHAFSAFALSWLVWEARPRLAPFWFAAAVLISRGRVDTHDHFAFQALAGAALGSLCGWIIARQAEGVLLPRVWNWLRRLAPRTRNRKS